MKMLFVVSGPSGSGKTTLVKRVLEEVDRAAFSVSHTTRKRRVSEVEGKDYFFVSRDTFKKMIKQDAFAEWAEVFGNFYGTSWEEIERKSRGKALILDVDLQGSRQIREKYKEAVLIFVFPPRFDEMKRRLFERGDEPVESILRRLDEAKKDILSYRGFDHIIINDRLDEAVQDLKAVIRSVGCRREFREKAVRTILATFLPAQKRRRD